MGVVHAADDMAATAAGHLARWLADVLHRKPRVSLALSGGESTDPVWESLRTAPIEWERVDIYQVDERIAPRHDQARNLAGLKTALLDHVEAAVHPMPVEDPDIDEAAAGYGERLPASLDVVHLGLGEDGHTASLVSGDPVLEVTDRAVAVSGYQGHRRMTLTFPTLARSAPLLWILPGDTTMPAGRVSQRNATLITDSL